VLAAWFPGAMAGTAIADILTGRFNPCARLPVTWPRDVGQIPIFYAERPTGRPADPNNFFTSKYLDVPVEPQFPFGHGLSYGAVELTNLRANSEAFAIDRNVALNVEVDATNRGERAAEPTVFLFIRDVLASVARPVLGAGAPRVDDEVAHVDRGAPVTWLEIAPAAFVLEALRQSGCAFHGGFFIFLLGFDSRWHDECGARRSCA